MFTCINLSASEMMKKFLGRFNLSESASSDESVDSYDSDDEAKERGEVLIADLKLSADQRKAYDELIKLLPEACSKQDFIEGLCGITKFCKKYNANFSFINLLKSIPKNSRPSLFDFNDDNYKKAYGQMCTDLEFVGDEIWEMDSLYRKVIAPHPLGCDNTFIESLIKYLEACS